MFTNAIINQSNSTLGVNVPNGLDALDSLTQAQAHTIANGSVVGVSMVDSYYAFNRLSQQDLPKLGNVTVMFTPIGSVSCSERYVINSFLINIPIIHKVHV